MKKIEEINQKEKESYMLRMSDYIADTIAINYGHYKNKIKTNFDSFFKQGFDGFNYNEVELQNFYDMIEDSLLQNYGLIRINDGYDKPLVIKDLKEEE